MFKVYSAGSIQDAYIIQGMLNEAGIETRILNEFAQGGVGEIPFTQAYPEIWIIREADRKRAKEIISQFDTHHRPGDDLFCPRCHESNPDTFETCWHCGNPLIAI